MSQFTPLPDPPWRSTSSQNPTNPNCVEEQEPEKKPRRRLTKEGIALLTEHVAKWGAEGNFEPDLALRKELLSRLQALPGCEFYQLANVNSWLKGHMPRAARAHFETRQDSQFPSLNSAVRWQLSGLLAQEGPEEPSPEKVKIWALMVRQTGATLADVAEFVKAVQTARIQQDTTRASTRMPTPANTSSPDPSSPMNLSPMNRSPVVYTPPIVAYGADHSYYNAKVKSQPDSPSIEMGPSLAYLVQQSNSAQQYTRPAENPDQKRAYLTTQPSFAHAPSASSASSFPPHAQPQRRASQGTYVPNPPPHSVSTNGSAHPHQRQVYPSTHAPNPTPASPMYPSPLSISTNEPVQQRQLYPTTHAPSPISAFPTHAQAQAQRQEHQNLRAPNHPPPYPVHGAPQRQAYEGARVLSPLQLSFSSPAHVYPYDTRGVQMMRQASMPVGPLHQPAPVPIPVSPPAPAPAPSVPPHVQRAQKLREIIAQSVAEVDAKPPTPTATPTDAAEFNALFEPYEAKLAKLAKTLKS